MSADRRKHPRIALAVDVDMSTGSNFYAGRTRDISVGGLFIDSNIRLEPGTEVSLALDLDGGAFKLTCVVVWHLLTETGASVGFGVEFKQLTPLMKKQINAFMKKRAPVAYEEAEAVIDSLPPPKRHPPPMPR
jgi:uncharacterized protein (TIGR02266 family)